MHVTGSFAGANVNFAGTSLTSSGGTDLFVAKYLDQGNAAGNGWAVQSTSGSGEYGQAIAVNGPNVYVASYFSGTNATIAVAQNRLQTRFWQSAPSLWAATRAGD